MNKRLYNVDFLRSLLCLAVLLCHSWAATSSPKSYWVAEHFLSGGMAVDFFFVIAGFFLYHEVEKENSLRNFFVKKVIRLLPVFVGVSLIVLLYKIFGLIQENQGFHYKDFIMNLFFIRNIALYNDLINYEFSYGNAPAWFMGSLFWTLIFYFVLFRVYTRKRALFASAIIMYICYVCRANETPLINIAFYLSMARSLPNIALGYFIATMVANIKDSKETKILKFFYTIVEGYCLYEIFEVLFIKPQAWTLELYYILCFACLFLSFTLKKGYISQLLDKKMWGNIGKYTYSIYMSQYLIQILLAKGNWLAEQPFYKTINTNYPLLDLVVFYVLLEVVIGILVYYLIETKCLMYFRQRFLVNNILEKK